MTTNNIIVLCAFIAYMIIMIVIGFVCSKGNKNNEDYFLGGRNLGSWTAAMSAQASDMSGWLLMGLPGAVYLAGTGEAWIAVGLLIGTILNWYIVSARLRKYTIVAGNSLTIPSFFKNRYRDHKNIIKIVSASIIAVFFTVYTASAFSSGAKLFATLFSDSASGDENYNRVYVIGLIVAAVVILVYTFMGGFKAVCTTDLIQGLMMIVAILLALGLSWYGWHRADALFALGIGIYILYSALRMGYEAVQSLLDRALPDEERQEIIDIVTSWPGVSGAHDLRTRQSGPTRFIQIHLEMEDSLPLVQAHMVADQVEQAILRRFPGSDVIIHQDPCSVVPREGKRSMLS